MVKRFHPALVPAKYQYAEDHTEMMELGNGDYVKYSDVKPLIEVLESRQLVQATTSPNSGDAYLIDANTLDKALSKLESK